MKTAGSVLRLLALAALLAPCGARGARNISLDADVRLNLREGERGEALLHRMGASLRETLADRRGDRLILFGLVEAERDLSEIMLHELYARYKGPLGARGVSVGRFRMPYGLLYDFDPSRFLYETPHEALLGVEADNGVMLSGLSGALDYAFALTQGYGHHHRPDFPGHGLAVARVGVTPGETEEISLGLSGAYGKTAHEHNRDLAVRRALVGADATLYLGRWLGRMELGAGRVAGRAMSAGFAAFDFALLPGLDLNLAASVVHHASVTAETWFAGFTFRPRRVTIRGGYRYAGSGELAGSGGHAGSGEARHAVTLQVYRLFSFGF